MKWIKITADMFDNRKIKQIESLPGGDSIIVVWVKLLCLAGTINDDGRIYLTPEIAYTDEMLSTQFNRPTKTIRLALDTFEKFGMIDIVDSFIHVSNWGTYQNVDGLAKVREQTKRRVQKHREKKAIEQKTCEENVTLQSENVTERNATNKEDVTLRNVTDRYDVTQCNATDKNKKENRKEAEEEQKREKKSKKEKTNDIPQPPYYPNDEKLDEAFCEFVEFRKQMKKPLLTKKAFTRAFNRLEELSTVNGVMDNDLAIKIIEQSIYKCWTDLWELKNDNPKSVYQQPTSKQGIDFDYLREKYKGE